MPDDSLGAFAPDTTQTSGAGTPAPSNYSSFGSPTEFSNTFTPMSATIQGADLAAQSRGYKSMTDTVVDFAQKGIPLAGAAIFNSFYNTAIEIGNFFGADGTKATIEDEFGPDSDTTAYYQRHTNLVEGAALAVGSLAPGLGALKVLKLAEGTAAFGPALRITTGLASSYQERVIASAATDIVGNLTGESLFGITALNKTKAILAGVADQALQGAVYQTATLATMHASPITDANTFSDDISDIVDASLGFAAFGGVIEAATISSRINKAVRLEDFRTKAQQASGALGKANLTAGDRIINHYNTLDNIPSTGLDRTAQMQYNANLDRTHRQIMEAFISATPGGDDYELASAMKSFIDAGRAAGTITADTLSENLTHLSKMGRYINTEVSSSPSEVFYLPASVNPNVVSTIKMSQMTSRIATGDYALSKAFQLADPATTIPQVGHELETLTLAPLSGTTAPQIVPKYSSATDAFKQGVDVYIKADGTVVPNLKSSAFTEVARPGESRPLSVAERAAVYQTGNLPKGSKPFNAVGMVLDRITGKFFGDDVLPVVGDFGKPKLTKNGLVIDIKDETPLTFNHKAGEIFDPTNPIEANSRYVWAGMKGIADGESIHPTDLPMLEQLYREMTDNPNVLLLKGISRFSTGTPIPTTAADLLDHIATIKNQKMIAMLADEVDADSMGMMLNAPTKGLTKQFNTTNPAEIMSPISDSANLRHIRVAYDIGTTKDEQGNLLRGMQATNYRIKLARDAGSDQMANLLGKMFGGADPSGRKTTELFSALQYSKGSENADILGAGQSFFKNANSDYNTFGQQSERIGRVTSEVIQMRHKAVSDALASSTNALKSDLNAGTEWANFTFVRHSTAEHYVMLSDADAIKNGLPPNTAILEGAVTKTAKGTKVDRTYLPRGFIDGSVSTVGKPDFQGMKSFYTLSPKVAAVERASQGVNNFRNALRSDWWKAIGENKEQYNPDRLYAPPIDTAKHPFHAYVVSKPGSALAESGGRVITAKTAEELQRKIATLGPEFSAFTKKDIARYKSAQGEFEYNRNFATLRVDSEMAKKGILNDVAPETRVDKLVDDLAAWHFRQEDLLIRDHVELHNAATFGQLRDMGDRFATTGISKFSAQTPLDARSARNPYEQQIKTAIGVSNKDNYPLMQNLQEKLGSRMDQAFNAVRDAFGATRKGLLPVEEAAKVSQSMGLGNPYGKSLEEMKAAYYGGLTNILPEEGVFRKFIATANTILGATVIRLDPLQQLIHMVTMPIMTSMEYMSATKDLEALTTVKVPGTGQQVPGLARVMYRAIKNFVTDDGSKAQLYSMGSGLIRDELQQYRVVNDALSMPNGKLSAAGWAQKMETAAQAAESLVGTKFVNRALHFMVSDIGRQLGEAAGQKGQDLLDTIGTFTGRAMGNAAAGQRAGIFNGPVGSAVGLFQSYQWNLMQQLLRHIGEGDIKALAVGAGLQTSIFGLQSLPGFHALNTLIQQRHGNSTGADLYSAANEALGPDVADYLLYGGLSNLLGISLYTRGDINPRRASILPVNPLDFPSVAAGIRVYGALAQLQSNISKGGDVPTSLLMAAEHNGLSRPLTGLIEMMQGYVTSPTGELISTTAGLSDLTSIANMSRILGGRPLEEAVNMDALYRYNALKAVDNARIEKLGVAAKAFLYSGSEFSPERANRFMSEYVKAGGTQANFNSWWLRETKGASVAEVNRVAENWRNPKYQNLQLQMGGEPMPDFRSTATTSANTPLTPGPSP